jgi:hypothetical protein
MFCPKCGTALVEQEGRLRCVPGEMGISQKMHEQLERISESPPSVPAVTPTVNLGDEWFCPADGFRMNTVASSYPTCPSCSRVLPGAVIHQLVELHPHRRWPPGWDRTPDGRPFRT